MKFEIYFLTFKINLMKKMNLNLFQIKGVSVKALAFFAFFFVWMSNASAQYVSPNDALVIIKGEVEILDDQAANTNNNTLLMDIKFKKDYFLLVMNDIEEGNSVDASIHDNYPRAKPSIHNSGWMVFSGNGPSFKTEAADLVAYAEQLLAE